MFILQKKGAELINKSSKSPKFRVIVDADTAVVVSELSASFMLFSVFVNEVSGSRDSAPKELYELPFSCCFLGATRHFSEMK